MRFRNEKKDTNIMINITSLIDVVFILLIFFAVTTSFVTPSSIKVDLPKAKGEAVEEKKNIRIAVDSTGALFLDGEAVKDEELESKLKVPSVCPSDPLAMPQLFPSLFGLFVCS